MNITIVNYGIGNLLSVRRAFEHIGANVIISSNPNEIIKSDRIIVPGVGAFNNCMIALKKFNLIETLLEFSLSNRPYLGICVGMQMLLNKSYEFGEHKGLGIIEGEVKKINIKNQSVPFIGWKKTNIFGSENFYYFVHSYSAHINQRDNLIGSYKIANTKVTSAIRSNNVVGVQFHPEKSGQDGLNLLKKFMNI